MWLGGTAKFRLKIAENIVETPLEAMVRMVKIIVIKIRPIIERYRERFEG
jgi:hypothetical protein